MIGLGESEKPLCAAVERITRKEAAAVDRARRRERDEDPPKTTSRTTMIFTKMTIPTIHTTMTESLLDTCRCSSLSMNNSLHFGSRPSPNRHRAECGVYLGTRA